MIELLMTDIDGCVLNDGIRHDQVALFQNVSKEIRNYIQTDGNVKKPPIVFCTGRGSEYVHALSQILDTRFALPSIVENGSYLFWPENRRIVPHPCLFDKESMVAEIKRLLLRNVVKKDIADIIHGKEGSVSLKSTSVTVAELKTIVRDALPKELLSETFITHSSAAVDVTIKGVDKGSMLEFYTKCTGIKVENMLVIGDSANDLSILDCAKTIACPFNATVEVMDAVRKKNGFIAKNSCTEGFWEIFHFYQERGWEC